MASVFSVNGKMRSAGENQTDSGGSWRREKKEPIATLERGRVTEGCRRIVGQC